MTTVAPLDDALKGQQAYLRPNSAEWQPLTDDVFRLLRSTDDADEAQVRLGRSAIAEMLAAALQIPNLGFFAGSGTSLGAVGGPSMWQLWLQAMCTDDAGTLSETAIEISETVRYFERKSPNIEHFLSQYDAYLAFNTDERVAAFVNGVKRVILHSCSGFLEGPASDISVYRSLLQKLARRRVRDPRLKVFTTNYDMCFETAASDLGMVTIDGFSYTRKRRFDGRNFSYDIVRRESDNHEFAAAKSVSTRASNEANKLYRAFLLRLNAFRVLDPACGSGNFLYLALKALRDVEKRVQVDSQELGLQAETTLQTGPHNILGLEINEFAAELARVTVWIGDIQWCRQNGWPHSLNPILKPLDGIENRDALMTLDGHEASWPDADVIVGNPPFIGDKKMRGELGNAYVDALRKTFVNRVPSSADFVCYWFEKARAQLAANHLTAAGFVSTNSIRGGANRTVLTRIVETSHIFFAWSDVPWVNDGAAVRVSMVGFGDRRGAILNGAEVADIHADLTSDIDVTKAATIPTNLNVSFQGVTHVQKCRRGGVSYLDYLAPLSISTGMRPEEYCLSRTM